MRPVPHVVAVRPLTGRVIEVTFDDGLTRCVDLSGDLSGPIFERIRDDEGFFRQAFIDPASRTVAWPNGVDLDPCTLHGDFEPAERPGA